jgi:hypothetical protein
MDRRAATDRTGTLQAAALQPAPRATPSDEGWQGGHRPAVGRRGQRMVATGRPAPAVAGLPFIMAGGALDIASHAGAALPLGAGVATAGHLLVLAGMVLTLAGALTAAARRPGACRGGHEEES